MDTPSERSLAAILVVCGFNFSGGTILFCMVLLLLLLLTRALFTVPASDFSRMSQRLRILVRHPWVPNEEISTSDGLLRANGADQAAGNVQDSWEGVEIFHEIYGVSGCIWCEIVIL